MQPCLLKGRERDANLATIVSGLSVPTSVIFFLIEPDLTTVPTDPAVVPWAGKPRVGARQWLGVARRRH